ncbi:replication protein A [Paraburkholderia terrae]|uniref:Replication protein A n=2 Tax=Paraburkholderia terrae TaxID=311230 RepID=A0ABM7TS05_9BURK|nr:replication protein A [Paraburkholderia terrae]
MLDYVLAGLLAGSVGALVGPGAAGKTMLLMQTACDIAAGAPIGGGILTTNFLSSDGAGVAFFLAEETHAVMHHRLQAAIHAVRDMKQFNSTAACNALVARLSQNLRVYPLGGAGRNARWSVGRSANETKAMVDACKDARLVIVDPLRRFHGGEENDAAHMCAVVEAFEQLAADTGAAVILSHHTNRSSALAGAGELASAARGSSALTDGVRWQANLSNVNEQFASRLGIAERERNSFVRLDIAKANYMKPSPPVMLRKDGVTGALSVWQDSRVKSRKRTQGSARASVPKAQSKVERDAA